MKLWIGENIKNLRGELGLTQEQLAGRLHCTAQAVSKWENGATAPDIAMLPLIAQALGVGIDALFAPAKTPYRHRGQRLLSAYESNRGDEESYRAAKAEYEKRLPENDPRDVKSYAYLLELRAWEYLKRAEAGYKRAIALGRPHFQRQLNLLLGKLGRAGEGVEASRAILQEHPDDAEAHITLAYALHGARQYDAAWEAARAALERFPQNALLLCCAGDIRRDMGDYGRALDLWRQSYAANPEDMACALYSIACHHYDQGNKEEGRAAWREVIDWLEVRGYECETAWPREMLAKLEG
ncbi:MAG: helix-turn-helix domain-containing protein [Oscillospiraceae bacterium]|nr:helix-turn-helix domain-containing protein [Oscillospiraceae bacterium]